MKPLLIIAATALLSACATAPTDPICAPLARYDRETQRAAAAELHALPPGVVLRRLIEDYGVLRARIAGACPG